MENFALLGSVVQELHGKFVTSYFVLLPLFFAVAVAMTWARGPGGGGEFVEVLKRAIIATLLLAGFEEITDGMLALTKGLADSISDMSGIDAIVQMAGQKANEYTLSPTSLLVGFNDLLIAGFAFLSFVVLYLARYMMLALYHFGWVFLSLLAPFLLLFHVFSTRITASLFRSLLEIACWRVAWAIMAAMLKSLPFGHAYEAGANYLTVVVVNLVIAMAMLSTPFIVHALVGGSFSAAVAGVGTAATAVAVSAPTRVGRLTQVAGMNSGGRMGRGDSAPPSVRHRSSE